MKTFTIDSENNISAFASKEEAAGASTTPFDAFTSASELAELTTAWPMSRLVEIWNSIPGITAVAKFTNKKIATERIWKAIENLGAGASKAPSGETEAGVIAEPVISDDEEPVSKAGAGVADVVPQPPETATKLRRTKKQLKAKKAAASESSGPREGSKTAQVLAMLQRKGGATLVEIMEKMAWQKHTVRGFMAGAMKKAGYTVESFKPEGGGRSYRIHK